MGGASESGHRFRWECVRDSWRSRSVVMTRCGLGSTWIQDLSSATVMSRATRAVIRLPSSARTTTSIAKPLSARRSSTSSRAPRTNKLQNSPGHKNGHPQMNLDAGIRRVPSRLGASRSSSSWAGPQQVTSSSQSGHCRGIWAGLVTQWLRCGVRGQLALGC